jgi:hypothetical protein
MSNSNARRTKFFFKDHWIILYNKVAREELVNTHKIFKVWRCNFITQSVKKLHEILCGDWPQLYLQILYKVISFLKNMNTAILRKLVMYLEYVVMKI